MQPAPLRPPNHRPQLDPQWAGPSCVLVGDLHGDLDVLRDLDRLAPPGLPILQVGDLGWGEGSRQSFVRIGRQLQREVYWIRGNWDARVAARSPAGARAGQPKRVVEGFWAIPDGALIQVGPWRVGCWGGAAHAHRMFRHANRRPGGPDVMDPVQQAASLAWDAPDWLLVHTPPSDWIRDVWAADRPGREMVPDAVADHVAALRTQHGAALPLVAGHLHTSVWDAVHQVRVLGEREWIWGPAPHEAISAPFAPAPPPG